MTLPVRSLSAWDALRFQLLVGAPAYLWGLAAPNPWFVPWLARDAPGPSTGALLAELGRKYAADHLWVWFPGGRTLVVLDALSMDAVLRSADTAADPMLKKRAFQFVPDALLISAGDAWQARRAFNEAVLGFGALHPHAQAFAQVVLREVDQLPVKRIGPLRWADFERLGERISHQVILGAGRVEPELTVLLARMVRRANPVFLPADRRSFDAFYDLLGRHLECHRSAADPDSAPAACLMHDSVRLEPPAAVRVPSEIGFWFFVLKDAVELHVARTLALIAAHDEVQERVRAEIRAAGALTGAAIERLPLLEACVHEQLRLWTPVPILLRRATRAFALRGEIPIESGQQILMHAGHYHRDPLVFGDLADRFAPGAALAGTAPTYAFSAHRQSCAGQFLARFLVKAALAALLDGFRFELMAPRFDAGRIPWRYNHFALALRAIPQAQGSRGLL